MYRLTQGLESGSPVVQECDRFLRMLVDERPDLVVSSGESHMPAISPTLNDGVVNTVRQIVNAGRREAVGGFVVADHGDVLGHYDRQDALIGGKPYNAGLFHSGGGVRGRRVLRALPAGRAGDPEDDPRCAPRRETARVGRSFDAAGVSR